MMSWETAAAHGSIVDTVRIQWRIVMSMLTDLMCVTA